MANSWENIRRKIDSDFYKILMLVNRESLDSSGFLFISRLVFLLRKAIADASVLWFEACKLIRYNWLKKSSDVH